MKKAKKIASLVVASALLTSSFAAITSVNAAEVDSAQTASADSTLRDKVGDGVMLHAFNWSYNTIKENLPAIAAAGYTTVQTSPVQQPKDYSTSGDVTGQWWKLYQPISFHIAEQSWLGTKDDLKSLCDEADKYGIKIICDIVSNHIANADETRPDTVSNQVKKYEPDFYKKRRTYTRTYKGNASDSSVQAVVQGHVSNCPDLVTNDTAVQTYIINLLKECIDCGVDGFRFDAAKHIETEDDGEYASDYWNNITTSASSYYTQKTGDDLYIYGEILNNCGADRSYSSYTKYINVTDNRTGDAVLYNVSKGKASTATNATYKSGVAASNAVLWAESHDTYEGNSGSSGYSNTSSVSDEDVVKAWAIVASRKDSTALFFARPGTALMGGVSTDTTYKSTVVSEINKFHNLFVGQSEKLGSSGNIAYVARGTSGIVLSNCKGTNASVSISGTGLADGKYTDTVSGAEFTVANGVLTGSIGKTGVAVVYNGTTTPKAINSVESGSFRGDTMTLTLGLENATSGTYCLDDSTPVKFTGTTSIRIGSDYKPGETINLTVTATDGVKTSSMVYKYTKSTAQESGVYVFFNPATQKGWSAPYQVYIYDETTNKGTVYKNANWPGEAMTLDPATGYYYYEVPKSSSISADEDDENQAASDFDLSTSANTRVIISEKGGEQYPGRTDTPISLNGSSKAFSLTKAGTWEDTTLTPTKVEIEATDVTKGSAAEPTTKPVSPTQPTTAQPATEPSGNAVYGDVNGDGDITVVDATLVQKHVVQLETLSADKQILADVNGDNTISVVDATLIQKYIVQLEDWGRTGDVYQAEQPTTPEPTTAEPTTVKPTAQPTTAEPTTKPADTYTLYFKTKLGWMTSDGVSLFAYDLDTGASYQFEQDTDAYPNVYTVEVPATVSNVSVYRSLSEVDEKPVGGDDGNVYNCWNATVSKTNNCITLSNDEAVSTAPYVPEQKPAFTLSRVYFDNSKAHYTDVYIYGWAESGLGNAAAHMNKIAGTDIWYYDFDTPLSPGANCFLFKDTESTWKTQTSDLTVADGKNCFRANPGSKSGGVWVSYSE
ncbi:MAG TPA: alpha-amylase family glycosyl hydrolase [Ruminococcus bromii]|nr:alpha-amylase family glycosyl hydrolase [Ruminococcus bromii]HJI87463.1 alpha-amylase family glycosyl hydrolase [Ruminococcus bromii]